MKRYKSQLSEAIDYNIIDKFFSLVKDKNSIDDIGTYIANNESISEKEKIAIVKNLRNLSTIILSN